MVLENNIFSGFPHYIPLGLSVAMETRVLIRSDPKPNAAFPPIPMMLQIKIGYDWPTGVGDIHV